jgi:hypothetical protein
VRVSLNFVPERSHGENLLDNISESIIVDILARPLNDVGVINRNDHLGASFRAEHGKNTSPASHVQNDLVLEQAFVIVDEVSIGIRAHRVFEHDLVNGYDNAISSGISGSIRNDAVTNHCMSMR